MNHEAPHYDEHPERTKNEWQTLMANGVVDTDFKPTQEYLASEQGQQEVEAQDKAHDRIEMVDRLIANAKEQAENGRYSNAEFERLKKKYEAKKEAYQKEADEQSEASMQDFSETFLDRNSVGTPEEEWVDDPQRIYSREEVVSAHGEEIDDNKEQEPISVEEAERRIAEHQDAINHAEALSDGEQVPAEEAERQDAISRAESPQGGEQVSTTEAEREMAKHQEMLGRAEALLGEVESEHRTEQLEALGDQLDKLRSNLAELFVQKNRILGPKHRDEYEATKNQYEAVLKEYLQLKTESIQGSNRTQQQINDELLQNYIDEDNKLLEAVRDRVDNGSRYRRIISRTIGNEYEKKAMLANGVASLGVAGAASVAGVNSRYQTSSPASESVSPQSAPSQPEAVLSASPVESTSESPVSVESAPEEPEPVTEKVEPVSEEPEPVSREPESITSEAPRPRSLSQEDQESEEILNSIHLRTLRNRFYNILDESDLRFLALDPAPANSKQRKQDDIRFEIWWDTLNDNQKNAIIQYENENQSSPFGGALRIWLHNNKLMNNTDSAPEVSTANAA
ncbi:hypothetical protein IIW29_00755 [Candidatus Saccharibacteria bacterium]|nr:hypothetical protein [Candidatus Saccharibacteria bacterium]